MLKKTLMAASVAAAIGLASSAGAAPILFDPTGAGGPGLSINTFEWGVNNAVGAGAVTAIGNGVGSTFDLHAHARLIEFQDVNGNQVAAPAAGTEFTYVTRFREVVTTSGATSATFATAAGGVNFFEIYFDSSADSNPLTGTGYNDGALIARGVVLVGQGSSSFSLQLPITTGLFDQAGIDNYGGLTTVFGTGAADVVAGISEFDPGFFVGGVSAISLFINASLITPFRQVNPSECFTDAASGGAIGASGTLQCDAVFGNGDGALGGLVPVRGAINGAAPGPDFQFQQDSNSTFQVPEPGSLALLGAALGGLGLFGRRRRLPN